MRTCFLALAVAALAACSGEVSESQKAAVSAEVEAALRGAYDLCKPDVDERMLALYPESGPVLSAAAGRITRSRDTLAAQIHYFWRAIGMNMKEPRWIWDSLHVEVLTPTSAVVTASYRIPHKTPRNQDHVIARAMTALFEKRAGKWVIVEEHLSNVPPSPDEPSMAPPEPTLSGKKP